MSVVSYGQQNWAVGTPPTGTWFDDNDVVSGTGTAPPNNNGAEFHFKQFDPNLAIYVTRDFKVVESITVFGQELWSQTLDPDENQPNGLWPLSRLDNMHIPMPDYGTWIQGNNGAQGSTLFHTVISH
jgi:hypothetical protein